MEKKYPNGAGPEWLACLSEISHYQAEIEEMDDEELMDNSYRVEVTCPPSDPFHNDRDWRTYRRFMRQEMHRRGLTTPTSL